MCTQYYTRDRTERSLDILAKVECHRQHILPSPAVTSSKRKKVDSQYRLALDQLPHSVRRPGSQSTKHCVRGRQSIVEATISPAVVGTRRDDVMNVQTSDLPTETAGDGRNCDTWS